jgi:hypothetical protein
MPEILKSPELQMLINNKETGFNYRQPRHEPWKEIYELYRDKVTINRLTQRQSVNLPLMKTTLRTLLKDIDDMPVIEFENRDNDKEAEVFQNEYWKLTLETNNAEIQDIVDKKQDFFKGRTFDSWQIVDGRIVFNIEDSEDMYVDRFMNPYDIDSSRFLIQTHIFKPLSSLKNNPDYDQEEVKKLELYFMSQQGIIKANDNQNSLEIKNQKMSDLGVNDMNDPLLGETYVELTVHYVFRANEKDSKGKELPEQIFVYVEAENQCILMKKPQEEIIGVTKDHFWRNHYRYNTWGDDVDKTDFWTDGIGDIVRTPNKVLNAWFSQMVENRTLRNFGMTFYNSSLAELGFAPNTFEPHPFGFYPVPGNPKDTMQRVDIPDLSESLDEMNYVGEMVQKATGATDTQQGVEVKSQHTLGEIQLSQGEAKARTKGISKFYTAAWKRRGLLFLKLIEAAPEKLNAVKIFKKGKNSDELFEREIAPKDWMTSEGYNVKVWSQDDKEEQDNKMLEKQNAVKVNMPNNPKVDEVYKRKLVEWAGYTPDEVSEVMEFERANLTTDPNMAQNGMTSGPQQPQLSVQQPPLQSK